ncbi:hypothetical protein NDU88_001222 [Pleurodeles waltl]|uniref:Uncharacterized protein n=1 Tax=Pleurodeles waltl TaxID=8319 RepID=A0AAV7Q3N0_PLEWA|nr:hypothetical protein NDU88_001222 [Pleurodeles waltl]
MIHSLSCDIPSCESTNINSPSDDRKVLTTRVVTALVMTVPEKRATSGRHINRRRPLGWERTPDAVRSPSVARDERRPGSGPPGWTRDLPGRAEPGPRVSPGSRLDRRQRMGRPRRSKSQGGGLGLSGLPERRDWAAPGHGIGGCDRRSPM